MQTGTSTSRSSSASRVHIIAFIKQVPTVLRIVLAPASAEQNITNLSSLRVSQALELLRPKCILEIRYNVRINLISVGTRSHHTSHALNFYTNLRGMTVKPYEPLSRSATSDIVRYVDNKLPHLEITQSLRFPRQEVAEVRHLGKDTLNETALLRQGDSCLRSLS